MSSTAFPFGGSLRAAKREPSLTERAYATLRREIITCQIPPGHEMSEPELAERLGMSKTPVREALGRLDQEGLVETFPRRGYRVTLVTIQGINDLFAVRSTLECTACALASRRMSEADLDRLDEVACASYTFNESLGIDQFINANRQLHTTIAEGSGNRRLHHLVLQHLEESERFFFLGAKSRDVNVETNREHSGIVAVLRSRDAAAASRVMAEHIESTRSGLTAAILQAAGARLTL